MKINRLNPSLINNNHLNLCGHIILNRYWSQVQLTLKGSSNRKYPQFEEPILGNVKVPRIESFLDSRNLSPSTAFDPDIDIV